MSCAKAEAQGSTIECMPQLLSAALSDDLPQEYLLAVYFGTKRPGFKDIVLLNCIFRRRACISRRNNDTVRLLRQTANNEG